MKAINFPVALLGSMLNDFSSAGNLHRLEFLPDPVYFVSRTMSQHGLLLLFAKRSFWRDE